MNNQRSCFNNIKKKSSLPLGMSVRAGLGAGLLGALVLAFRFGWKKKSHSPLSEAISPAIFATRVLNTSSGEIVYHTSGTGEPLLFLHGVFPGASSFEWSKVYPNFATHYQVLVPDLIGFGESQRPRPAITAEAQMRALIEFLDTIAPNKKVVLIASGLTANLALSLSLRYPNKVARILLWMPLMALKGASLFGRYHPLSCFPSLARIVYHRQLSTENSIRQWLLRSYFPVEDPSFEEAVAVLTSTAQQYGAEYAFLAQTSRKFWHTTCSRLTTITAPITLLLARESERQPHELITSLRPWVNRLSIVEIEALSALAPLVNPTALVTAIHHELG